MAGESSFWLRNFLDSAKTGPDISNPDEFYTELKAFVYSPSSGGSRFASDLVWIDETDPALGLKSSRMSGAFSKLENSAESVEAMQSMRATVSPACPIGNEVANSGQLRCYAFSYPFIFFEQYAVIEVHVIPMHCSSSNTF